MEKSRVARKNAIPMSELIRMYLKQTRLGAPLNSQRIFRAWDEASGAGPYTLKRYFRDGKLYITVNSSVIRSQLYFQKALLVEKVNALLREDELYTSEGEWKAPVKELILK